MIQVITIIAPLFIIIFASALLQKFGNISKEWEIVLNEFALKIGLPVLVFSTLSTISFSLKEEGYLVLVNSLFLVFSFFLAILIGKIFKMSKKSFSTFFICFVFSNVAYLGIPVLTQVRGAGVLPEAILIAAIYLFWIFTFGIGYLEYSLNGGGKDIFKGIVKGFIKNPLLISVLLGFIVAGLNIEIPFILSESLRMVSASVTPIVLIVIGFFIGKSKDSKITEWYSVIGFSAFTLLIFPAIFYFLIRFFSLDISIFSNSIIQAAMPLGITPFALADRYNLDKNFIARSIVLSTIISAISLPFWISILH